jgi:hypothetical protein
MFEMPTHCVACGVHLRGGATRHEKSCPFYPMSYQAGVDAEEANEENMRITDWPDMDTVNVYVPKPGTIAHFTIAGGSAIVGQPVKKLPADCIGEVGPDTLHIYYEGNLNDACNLHEFHEKVQAAYSRMIHKYPTVANMYASRSELVVIGQYCPETREVTITDPATLEEWKKQ